MEYKQRRQSQIVNNFFTLVSIVIITAILSLYVKYGPKPKHIHSNLPCQKLTYTYDQVNNQKLLPQANKLLNSGAYQVDGGLLKPRFGKSYLKDIISIEQANKYFVQAIIKQPIERNLFLKIKYEILENDKNDPRKTDADRKHAGVLLTSFRMNQKEVFRMYTEFLQYDKETIKEKINCTIKAFRHNAKE